MTLTITVQNFRGLRNAKWSPDGVALVVGPNGSGKSTLLNVYKFINNVYVRSFSSAIEHEGGPWGFRHFMATPDEDVSFRVELDEVAWELRLPVSAVSVTNLWSERLLFAGNSVMEREGGSQKFVYKGITLESDGKTALRRAYDVVRDSTLEPLDRTLKGFRNYHDYRLSQLRINGSRTASELFLHQAGENLFSVLRNWRDKRDSRVSYDLVIDGMRDAFPDLIEDFEFDVAGQTVTMNAILRKMPDPVPAYHLPDGVLVALLHLCAVAGAPDRAVVGIDEMENALHPYAIRSLTNTFREVAARRGLTVLLSTHSPVLLDEFSSEPEHVLVMEPGAESVPVKLSDSHNPQWLAQFSLGKLYSSLEFGAPLTPEYTPVEKLKG